MCCQLEELVILVRRSMYSVRQTSFRFAWSRFCCLLIILCVAKLSTIRALFARFLSPPAGVMCCLCINNGDALVLSSFHEWARSTPKHTCCCSELHTFINCWCCFRGTFTDRARKKRLLHAKSYTRDAHKHRHWLNNNALFLMGQDYLNCDRTRHPGSLASFSLVVLLRFKYMSPVVISNHFAPTNSITITVINYYYYYPTGTQ